MTNMNQGGKESTLGFIYAIVNVRVILFVGSKLWGTFIDCNLLVLNTPCKVSTLSIFYRKVNFVYNHWVV